MEINYSLTEDNFLTFQMYSSGESEHQKNKRMRGRIIVPIIWGLIALYFFSSNEQVLGIVFLVVSVLWLFVYPVYSKWLHVRHFKNHIKENYRGKLDVEATLRLEEDGFYSSGGDNEGTLKYSGVDELVELESLYLIRLKQPMTLLLPRERIEKSRLEDFMKEVSKRTGLEIKDHRTRHWRYACYAALHRHTSVLRSTEKK